MKTHCKPFITVRSLSLSSRRHVLECKENCKSVNVTLVICLLSLTSSVTVSEAKRSIRYQKHSTNGANVHRLRLKSHIL